MKKTTALCGIGGIFLAGALCAVIALAKAPAAAPERAKVVDAFGTAEKRLNAKAAWQRVNVGDLLTPGTTLRTGDRSAALIQLPGSHVVRVGAKTTVEMKALGKDRAYS